MANQIQIRRDTSANWASINPVLTNGEIGYDTTLKRFKIGDGSTAWTSLLFLPVTPRYVDTSANLASTNPVLASGELGYDTTLKKLKIGDGSTAWSSLADFQAMGEWRDVASASTIYGTNNTIVDFYMIHNAAAAASGTTSPLSAAFYFDPADYAVTGRTTQVRLVATVRNGNVAVTAHTMTASLYAAQIATGNFTKTAAAAIATAAVSVPTTANTMTTAAGTAVTAPAAGNFIVVGINSVNPNTTSTSIAYGWKLQVRVV